MASAVISRASPCMMPRGPFRKPYSRLPGRCRPRRSNRPAMTLWPPGPGDGISRMC